MSINSCVSNYSSSTSLSAKLKRLQIEESILLQSSFKCIPEYELTRNEINAANHLKNSEFNTFSAKIKNSYKEIKLIFQDIKTSTSSKEILKSIDIDDIKKNTHDLENRIKTFKSYLQSAHAELKSKEQQLNRDLSENPVLVNKFNRHPRVQTAKYSEFVPSPVKKIMNSPFKCIEVQQFQEFMMNSVNRCGGWNEYHHNIFVNQWVKHFGPHVDISSNEGEDWMENSPVFHLFLNELFPKLQGISEEEIISHTKWYSKYIYLKKCQQIAVDKWRSNRTVMKSAQVDPDLQKNSIRKRINERKHLSEIVDKNNVNVSGDPNETQYSTSKLMNNNKFRCFVRECLSAVNGSTSHENNSNHSFRNNNVRKIVVNDCGQPNLGDKSLTNYQKSTKQWNNRVNSKADKIETQLNNLETIKSL